MSQVGGWVMLVGLVGLLHALCWYVINRRDPYRDQMGGSIRFDRHWVLSAATAALGAKLLWNIGWGGVAGIVLLAYIAILPIKAGVKRSLGR